MQMRLSRGWCERSARDLRGLGGHRFSLLIVGEIGYLPVTPGGNLFFQVVNARHGKGAMILNSNRGFAEWGKSSAILSSPPRQSHRPRAGELSRRKTEAPIPLRAACPPD